MKNQDLETAKTTFKKLLKSKDPLIKYSAMEALAKVYFQENESEKSYDLLSKVDPQFLKEGKCLLCKLAFEWQNYELVAKYSRDIYALEPSYEIALLNSQAFGHLHQPASSGAWLETASQFGADYREKAKEALVHPAFDSVRTQQAFTHYAEKI